MQMGRSRALHFFDFHYSTRRLFIRNLFFDDVAAATQWPKSGKLAGKQPPPPWITSKWIMQKRGLGSLINRHPVPEREILKIAARKCKAVQSQFSLPAAEKVLGCKKYANPRKAGTRNLFSAGIETYARALLPLFVRAELSCLGMRFFHYFFDEKYTRVRTRFWYK